MRGESAPMRFDVDAVAFDLDGTLLDTVHDLASSVNTLLVENDMQPLPEEQVRDLVGKGIGNLISRAVTIVRGEPPGVTELAALLERYEAIYAGELGRRTQPYDGMVEALHALRAMHIKLAVVTNKLAQFIEPHLRLAGIARLFDTTVGAGDAPARKPDRAPLDLAARRMGVAVTRMLMVGDSVNDVQAARAAGCPVIVVPYGYREGLSVEALGADAIVASLAELPALCRRGG